MNHPQDSTRREFVKQAALGTVALGTVGKLAQQSATVDSAALAARPKSKIHIGVKCITPWLKSKNDDDLQFQPVYGVSPFLCVRWRLETKILAKMRAIDDPALAQVEVPR